MTSSGKGRLTPQTIRLLAFGWMGIVVFGGGMTFVLILLVLGGNQSQTAAPPTPTFAAQTLPTVPPGITPTVWMPVDNGVFALGGQIPSSGAPAHPDLMHNAGMSWLKYKVEWHPGDTPDIAGAFVQEAHAAGFRVLLSISGQPYPQVAIDYAGFVEFLTGVATFQPDAIEVWNEMNLDREWPAGQIDPATYINEMLIPAHNAITATSPNTMIIVGALAPTGAHNGTNVWEDRQYVAGLYAAGAQNYADCIGVHHNSGTTSPSATTGHIYDTDNNGDGQPDNHYSWYFMPTIQVYRDGMNGTLPICLTEFGYFTPAGFESRTLPENFAWGAQNTLDEHVAWLSEGVQIARDLGYVRLVIVWNVDVTTWDDANPQAGDPQAGYAILRPNGTCPACVALQAVMMGN